MTEETAAPAGGLRAAGIGPVPLGLLGGATDERVRRAAVRVLSPVRG